MLPCPDRVPKDLVEGHRIAVYFAEKNAGWCEGTLFHVHKGKKHVDNITVRYEKTKLWNASVLDFCASKDNYGVMKDWVLLDPAVHAPNTASDNFSDGAGDLESDSDVSV